MLLYRLSRSVYANDLTGTGSRLYGGRWNSIGKSLVYLASSRSLAVLEVLVHLPPALLPSDYELITIDVPDDFEEVRAESLPGRWQQFPHPDKLKSIGDTFIARNKKLMLKVPSAIVDEEHNYLLNPAHPKAAQVKIKNRQPFAFDQRLL